MRRLAALFLALVFLLLPTGSRAAVFYPTSFTLANGLQFVVVPNHLAPVVNQMVWYKVGSSDEVPGKTGLAHYLEHLMFRGTLTMAPGDFSKIIAAQGGEDNAFTSFDYTSFHETVAQDRLPMIMKMEADRMQNLNIMAATATPELSVVLNERQQRTDNNPEGKFEETLRHDLMPRSPYGIPVIGWKSEIEKFTAVDAQHFYKMHYAPNNTVIVISGDVDPDKVKQLATEIYGPIPQMVVAPRLALPPPSPPSLTTLRVVDAGVEQPELQMASVVPSYSTQKKNEAYAYEVLSEVLDSGEVGLLYRNLAVEQGLASAVDTNYDPDTRGDAVFTIALTPHPGKDPKQLEHALRALLKNAAAAGLPPQLVVDAKERMKRSAIFARDSLIMPGYSFGMALTTGHTVDDVEDWPDRINAVTVGDVNAALRDLVHNPYSLMGALLPDAHASAAAREAARSLISHDMGIR